MSKKNRFNVLLPVALNPADLSGSAVLFYPGKKQDDSSFQTAKTEAKEWMKMLDWTDGFLSFQASFVLIG